MGTDIAIEHFVLLLFIFVAHLFNQVLVSTFRLEVSLVDAPAFRGRGGIHMKGMCH